MTHHEILVQKLTIHSNFCPGGWKKLIFDENGGPTVLRVLWKNGYQIFRLPEVTSVWSDRKWKNFETGSQKIYFWKAYKKLFRKLYSRFSISSHASAVEVFKVLSVAMTSSPEVVWIKKFSMIFGVFGPTEFDSKTVHGPALRLAKLSTPYLAQLFWFTVFTLFTFRKLSFLKRFKALKCRKVRFSRKV